MLNIVAIIMSIIVMLIGLLSNAPINVKILLVIAISTPLLCSIGEWKNK